MRTSEHDLRLKVMALHPSDVVFTRAGIVIVRGRPLGRYERHDVVVTKTRGLITTSRYALILTDGTEVAPQKLRVLLKPAAMRAYARLIKKERDNASIVHTAVKVEK